VHQTGHVGGGNHFRTRSRVVFNPISPHRHRYIRLVDRKRSSKPTTLIRPFEIDQFQSANTFQQSTDFIIASGHRFARPTESQLTQPMATLVQADLSRKTCRKLLDL
jgi:hypothetical protein